MELAITQETSCQACGAAARVHILEGYAGGTPVFRAYCLTCVQVAKPARVGWANSRRRVGIASAVIVFGVLVAGLSLLGDYVPAFQGKAGFGWYQEIGVLTGAVVFLTGAFIRSDWLAVPGGLLLLLSLASDWLSIPRSPGVGWRQAAVIGAALLIIASAVMVRTVLGRREEELASIPELESRDDA